MPEIPLGFSFDPTDDGFVLRNKTDDGIVTEIKVPAEQVQGLKAEIDLWSDRRLSALRVASGAVQPIVVHWVGRVGVWPDAVGENVLLMIQGLSGGNVNLSIPLNLADQLAVELAVLLRRCGKRTIRQSSRFRHRSFSLSLVFALRLVIIRDRAAARSRRCPRRFPQANAR